CRCCEEQQNISPKCQTELSSKIVIFFHNLFLFDVSFWYQSACRKMFCGYTQAGPFTTTFHTKPKVQIYEKLSYEALNPPFCKTDVGTSPFFCVELQVVHYKLFAVVFYLLSDLPKLFLNFF